MFFVSFNIFALVDVFHVSEFFLKKKIVVFLIFYWTRRGGGRADF